MSFASEIKKELINIESDKCCIQAELAALIRMNSELSIGKNTLTLDIQTENVAIARRIYILIKETYDYKIEILVRKNMRLKKNNIYIIRLKEKVIELLSQLDLKTSDEYITQTIKPRTITLNCCKRAYLRGAFLARGSINNPETSSYHLEIFNFDQTHSIEILELMNYFDLNAREIKRRNGFVVYLKEAEKITEFLSIIGAHNALFKFEDVRIVRDMRNSVNRLVNCETANMNKTISASVKQVENIKYIKEQIGLEALPERLKELAETRLENPEVSLKEIGELVPGTRLSKSGVNHRFKQIEKMAEELRGHKL